MEKLKNPQEVVEISTTKEEKPKRNKNLIGIDISNFLNKELFNDYNLLKLIVQKDSSNQVNTIFYYDYDFKVHRSVNNELALQKTLMMVGIKKLGDYISKRQLKELSHQISFYDAKYVYDKHSPITIKLNNGYLKVNKKSIDFCKEDEHFFINNSIERNYDKDFVRDDKNIVEEMLYVVSNFDDEMKEYMINMLATSFMGNYSFETIFFLQGTGNNGKTMIKDLLSKTLGDANMSELDYVSITNNRFATSLLENKLVNFPGDVSVSVIKNTGKLKQIVSGEMMTVEQKNVQNYSMKPNASMFMGTNDNIKLTQDANDGGIDRRRVVVPFDFKYEGQEKGKINIPELMEEKNCNYFFNLILSRAIKLFKSGIDLNLYYRYDAPQRVLDAIRKSKIDESNAVEFVEDFLKKDILTNEKASELLLSEINGDMFFNVNNAFNLYKAWLNANQLGRPSGQGQKNFKKTLINFGIIGDREEDEYNTSKKWDRIKFIPNINDIKDEVPEEISEINIDTFENLNFETKTSLRGWFSYKGTKKESKFGGFEDE